MPSVSNDALMVTLLKIGTLVVKEIKNMQVYMEKEMGLLRQEMKLLHNSKLQLGLDYSNFDLNDDNTDINDSESDLFGFDSQTNAVIKEALADHSSNDSSYSNKSNLVHNKNASFQEIETCINKHAIVKPEIVEENKFLSQHCENQFVTETLENSPVQTEDSDKICNSTSEKSFVDNMKPVVIIYKSDENETNLHLSDLHDSTLEATLSDKTDFPSPSNGVKKSLSSQSKKSKAKAVKKLSCSVCCRMFSNYSHLKSHMQIHREKKRFSCSICNKFYTRNHDLKRHMATHTDNVSFISKYARIRSGRKQQRNFLKSEN